LHAPRQGTTGMVSASVPRRFGVGDLPVPLLRRAGRFPVVISVQGAGTMV
jgi:hypothetical protein